MPLPMLDLDILEELSRKKIQQQIQYLTLNRMPGLMSGISSTNDDNGWDTGSTQVASECQNNTLSMLPGTRDPCNMSNTERQSCEASFKLCYAGRAVNLRLLFTPRQPWMPPDLLLQDEIFMEIITTEMLKTKVNSLVKWPQGRDDAVAELVHQIYALYKEFQILKLQQQQHGYELLQFHTQLLEYGPLTEADLEVYISDSEQIVCVQLPVDFDQLPDALFDETKGVPKCILQFIKKGSSGVFVPSLQVSPRAAALIHDTDDLPPLPTAADSIVTYMLTIMEHVRDKIKQAHHAFEIRKQIIAQLLCQYDASIAKYDSVRYTSMELLLQDDDFHYNVHIVFPLSFPHDSGPNIQLSTICQQEGEKVVTAKVPKVSHSPKSDPDTILAAMIDATKAFAPSFRRQRSSRFYSS